MFFSLIQLKRVCYNVLDNPVLSWIPDKPPLHRRLSLFTRRFSLDKKPKRHNHLFPLYMFIYTHCHVSYLIEDERARFYRQQRELCSHSLSFCLYNAAAAFRRQIFECNGYLWRKHGDGGGTRVYIIRDVARALFFPSIRRDDIPTVREYLYTTSAGGSGRPTQSASLLARVARVNTMLMLRAHRGLSAAGQWIIKRYCNSAECKSDARCLLWKKKYS